MKKSVKIAIDFSSSTNRECNRFETEVVSTAADSVAVLGISPFKTENGKIVRTQDVRALEEDEGSRSN
jgi:hypothetical protein